MQHFPVGSTAFLKLISDGILAAVQGVDGFFYVMRPFLFFSSSFTLNGDVVGILGWAGLYVCNFGWLG